MLNAAVLAQALGMMFYTISYSLFIYNSGKHIEVSMSVTGMSGAVGAQMKGVLSFTPTD